jgi:hypothetical protein
MPPLSWNAVIVDAPESKPWAELGDLLVVVRTPRSRNFITVEVARSTTARFLPSTNELVVSASAPEPWMPPRVFSAEIALGTSLHFVLGVNDYDLTLAKLEVAAQGPPWVACELVLEQHFNQIARGTG